MGNSERSKDTCEVLNRFERENGDNIARTRKAVAKLVLFGHC